MYFIKNTALITKIDQDGNNGTKMGILIHFNLNSEPTTKSSSNLL